jgi:hypothetical protein
MLRLKGKHRPDSVRQPRTLETKNVPVPSYYIDVFFPSSVYLNGEFLRPASRILLTPRLLNMHSIEAIYESVQDRVITGKGAIAK